MANPVLVSDLAARFRPLTTDETAVAQALLDDAWAIALVQIPSLATRLDGGDLDSSLVRAVISAMVLRVMRNPDGIRTWSVDDYSQTRDATVSGGVLYLSDDELGLLSPAGGAGDAFTITAGNAGPGFSAWPSCYPDPNWY